MSGIVRSRGRKKSPTDSYLFFEPPQPNIGSDLQANEQMFKTLFQNCSDVHFRELSIPGCTTLLMIYVNGMINTEMTMTNVLKPLLYEGLPQGAGALDSVSQLFDQELFSILQRETSPSWPAEKTLPCWQSSCNSNPARSVKSYISKTPFERKEGNAHCRYILDQQTVHVGPQDRRRQKFHKHGADSLIRGM